MRIRPFSSCTSNRKRQHGSAILIILALIGLGAAFLLVSTLNKANSQIGRDKVTSAALAQAKEALIGYAVTYRDSHPNNVFGYLPCPDVNNDGNADANQGSTQCAGKDIPVVGRLPWKTLGLPPLRDSQGECLWYAVSGTFKAVAGGNLTDFMNWDTTGQLIIQDASGAILAGATPHERPLALILAPRTAIGGQIRTSAGTSECGGSNTATDYLENAPISTGAGTNSTITLSTAASVASGTNNDQGLWITSKDIFDRIKKRSDFKGDIDTMMIDLRDCLDSLAPTFPPLPAASAVNKGVGDYPATPPDPTPSDVLSMCKPTNLQKLNVLKNWQDNLLYAKLPTPTTITIDGGPSPNACSAVLFFGGERTATQTRATALQKGDSAMYLEGTNASSFPAPAGTAYSGASKFSNASPAQDLIACITGVLPGRTLVTFANSFGSFTSAGSGIVTDPVNKTVAITPAAGIGGCFWNHNTDPLTGKLQPIQLAGKTLRAHYDFTFTNADPSGGTDLGNGITISFVRGDIPSTPPTIPPTYVPPNTCGTQTEMGVLRVSDFWGSKSLFVETDVHHDSVIQLDVINVDPAGNHTAIMANGNLTHWPTAANNGYTTSACDGTAQGCAYSPADKFEESPAPLTHNQRVEIHTGCNSTCSSCNIGGAYAQIKVWTDCASCNDTSIDFAATASASRCTLLDPALNTFYFGITGGFSSGGSAQGVTIQNLNLRTQ